MFNKSRGFIFLIIILSLMQICSSSTDTAKLNQKCNIDKDCSPPYIICGEEGKCKHKKLFGMTSIEIVVLIAIVVLQGTASIVSIAGGSFVVPLVILGIGFSAGQATAMSNAFAIATSLTKYLIGITKRDPTTSFKTIINYNGVISLIPSMTLFSTIGGIVATFLPEVFVLFILLFVLIGSIIVAIFQLRAELKKRKQLSVQQGVVGEKEKGSDISKIQVNQEVNPLTLEIQQKNGNKDTETIDGKVKESQEKDDKLPPLNSERQGLTIHDKREEEDKSVHLAPAIPLHEESELDILKRIEDQKKIEGYNFYYKKFLVIVVVVFLAVMVALFRGGKSFKSIIGVKKCTGGEWGVIIGYIALLGLVPLYVYHHITKEQKLKERLNWKSVVPNEVQYNKNKMTIILVYCSFVGFLSTVIGIGGSILLTPFLIELKFMPVKASYIIIVNTLVSKIASVLIHIVSGELLIDYTLFYGFFIILAGIISEYSVLWAINKTKSQLVYPIIFLAMVVIAMVLVVVTGVKKWVEDSNRGINVWKFKSYC